MNLFPLALLLLAPAFAQVKLSRYACAEASYTERTYTGQGGYALTLVTTPGSDRSEILLSKDKGWIGNFGSALNAQLASGGSVHLGLAVIKEAAGPLKAAAVLRSVTPLPTAACDAAMSKYAPGASLMLLTTTQAFYYHEDCDICAQVDRCDLKTSQVGTLLTAHSIRCEDLAPYVRGQVVVKACR